MKKIMKSKWINDSDLKKTHGDYKATCSKCNGLVEWLLPIETSLDYVLGFRCPICQWEMKMIDSDESFER